MSPMEPSMKPLWRMWEDFSHPRPDPIPGHQAPAMVTEEYSRQLDSALKLARFQYVAEGRANAVFAIHLGQGCSPGDGDGDGEGHDLSLQGDRNSEDHNDGEGRNGDNYRNNNHNNHNGDHQAHQALHPRDLFKNALLRVPKWDEHGHAVDYLEQDKFRNGVINQNLPVHVVVPQVLVHISESMALELNAARDASPKRRDDGTSFREGYAMVMQDMRPSPDYLCLEFKPKWLAQAPLAPENAIRCRNCAREAYRIATNTTPGQPQAPVPFCPLGLLHSNKKYVRNTVDHLVHDWPKPARERLESELGQGETKKGPLTTVLEKLRALQVKGDQGTNDPSDPGFLLAMTLRDCTCFVHMPIHNDLDNGDTAVLGDMAHNGSNNGSVHDLPLIVKIADVDLKDWKQKAKYWSEWNRTLVEEGWYTAEEKLPVKTECVLQAEVSGTDLQH